MVGASTVISRPPVYVGTASAALVLGIVGIIVPGIGFILGILAIIFGSIALRRKTSRKASAIVGTVLGGIAIIWSVLVMSLFVFFAGHQLFGPSERDNAVTAQINEKKSFAVGETAKMGPIDVTITSVERHYTPTAEEVTLAKGNNPKEVVPGGSEYNYGTVLDESEVEYVRVAGTVRLNGSPFLGDNDLELASMHLNNVLSYAYSGGLDGYKYETTFPKDAAPFTDIFRIRKGSKTLTLTRYVYIWKTIYPIVGTEGAPQASLTYTMALN